MGNKKKSSQFGSGQSQPHTDGRRQARPQSTGGSGSGSKSGKVGSSFGGSSSFGPGPRKSAYDIVFGSGTTSKKKGKKRR